MYHVADYHQLQVEIETQQCTIPEDERSRMQASLERLAEAVEEFPESQLALKVVFHSKSEIYHGQAKLKLPGKSIVTGHGSQWLDDALMRTLAKAQHRVERYKEHPDAQAIEEAERRAELDEDVVAAADPDQSQAGAAAERQDYAAFRRALAGHEAWVRDHVGRWIQRYPEVQSLLGEAFDTEDFVEEVFLLAFEHYAERPRGMATRDWLQGFIEPAVQALWHEPLEREAVSYAQSLGTPHA